MVIWSGVMLFLLMSYITPDPLMWGGALIIMGIPILFVIQGLFREVPLPVRFNRQRRDVCVAQADGTYWIVPWESVTAAAATQQSSVGQAGTSSFLMRLLP
jgi:hypothetical protein